MSSDEMRAFAAAVRAMFDCEECDDDDEWFWEDPFRKCYGCDGKGYLPCRCGESHVVVAHCFTCDNETVLECGDCEGFGYRIR